ncbi:hypothetical protein HNR47_003374 [Methylopila jiangsuensis]|nr:hypothetical protein [Methylopila jiangsuensis]MDR6287344.1 hypothetical protein [Methylopila jiangsuensis]
MDDLTERLRAAVTEAFGATAGPTRLAVIAGGQTRRAAYWLKGESRVPDGVVEKVEAAVAVKRELDPDGALGRLIAEWRERGLHDELISAALANAHLAVTDRTID